MNNFLFKYAIAYAAMMFCFSNCCKTPCEDITNPECENYDPCHAQTNAAFIVIDSLGYGTNDVGHTFVTDTFWQNKYIRFRALHDNATYEWKIGSDPHIWTKKEFNLYFDEAAVGNISVRLVTTSPPNADCPGDDGRDTSYRTIYVFPGSLTDLWESLPMFGTFTGYDTDNPDVLYDVSINVLDSLGHFGYLIGLNNCLDNTYDFLASYRGFVWESDNIINCSNPKGYATLGDDLKTLTILYNVGEVGGIRTEKTFIGIKN